MLSIPSKVPKPPIKLDNNTWMVVCTIDPVTNKFIPITDPSESEINFHQRSEWTEPEEKLLEELVRCKGSRKWTAIADRINETFYEGEVFRTGKHCREHWLNHLDPTLKKGEWTPGEDQIIFANQAKIGNKWSVISKLLPGRTENQVKNRWKSILRKASKWIKTGAECVKIEWGGEIGSGEGSDSGDVTAFESGLEFDKFYGEGKDMQEYYDDIGSPSDFLIND